MKINNITNIIDEADDETAVFYYMSKDSSIDTLLKRISNCRTPKVYINKQVGITHPKIEVLSEKNFFETQKKYLDQFFPMPKTLKLMGVTGTNGKTSVCHFVLQLAKKYNIGLFTIGTLGLKTVDGEELELKNTTPDYLTLRKLFFKYGQNYQYCMMEVSSHALDMNRLFQLEFIAGAWTSFSQDHLDYHGGMEHYFSSKKGFITNYKIASENFFIPESQEGLIKNLNPLKFKKILSYNKKKADPLFLSASYNCDNLSLALNLINLIQKVNFNEDFSFLTAPPGRYEAFNHKDQLVIVDYAHTPDALENICRQMKKDFPEKKLVLVFGCGGDRDRKKRPIMGKIATELCSKVYLTSDNPRSENPAVIIDEILKGTDGKKIHIQVDRKIAIIDAFKNLKPNEILLIAGKGHETYQEIMGKKWPFSDKEVVQGIL